MAEQFYSLITLTGQAKIANANVLGNKVNFVKLKVGDGGGSYYNPTESATDIRNKVWEGSINSIYVDESNPNWIVIESIIPSDVGGFFVREAGVYDDENNLIVIGKYPETYKPVIAEGSAKDLVIRIILEVSNSESVTLKIDPTVVLATKKDVFILESRIAKNETDIQNLKLEVAKKVDKIDYIRAGGYAVTSGTNTAYIISTTPAPTTYGDGMAITILPHADCGANPMLNWNDLGASSILNQDGTTISAGDMKKDIPYQLVRVGSNFFIRSGNNKVRSKLPWFTGGWINCWSPAPLARANITCAYNDDYIYSICGYVNNRGTNSTVPTGKNYRYDVKNNTWETLADYIMIFGSVAVTVGNLVYMIGGNTDVGSVNYCYCYNSLTNTWTAKTSFPAMSANDCVYGAYYLNGCIYVVASSYEYTIRILKYTISTDTWTSLSSQSIYTDANIGGICACGDGDSSIFITTEQYCYRYNILTDTFSSRSAKNFVASSHHSICIDHIIHIIARVSITDHRIFDFMYDTINDIWSSRQEFFKQGSGYGLANVTGTLYLIGGIDNEIGTLRIYDDIMAYIK